MLNFTGLSIFPIKESKGNIIDSLALFTYVCFISESSATNGFKYSLLCVFRQIKKQTLLHKLAIFINNTTSRYFTSVEVKMSVE